MYSRDMREAAGVKGPEIVQVLKSTYRRINKTTVSMVDNPADYGVRFTPEAEAQVLEYLAERGPARPKKDRHKHKRRVQLRMSEDAYQEFERLRQQMGFSTAQGFLEHIFHMYRRGRVK